MTKEYSKDLHQPEVFTWKPRKAQEEIIAGQRQVTVCRCCRQTMKTDLSAYLAVSALITCPVKIPIGVASFSLKNARAVIWARILEMLYPLPSFIQHKKAADEIVNTRTGSLIRLHGLSKEHGNSIRGHSYAGKNGQPGILIVDEYQKVPYDIFVNAALPTLSAGDEGQQGWLFCIGTPSGSHDLMALMEAECDDPLNGPQGADTHVRFHFPASVLSQPPYFNDHKHLTPEFLALQKRRNPLGYAQEYEADISASAADTVFDQPLLAHATTTDTPVLSRHSPVSAGLDFAVRKDKCLVVIRNSKNFVAIVEIPYAADPYGFVRQVKALVSKYQIRALAIDRGGCGEVIADMLEDALAGHFPCEDCRGVIAGEKAYSSTNFNLRSELFAMLRDFLSHKPNTISTSLNLHQTLLNELSAITQKPNDRGTFQIASRQDIIEKIGHSPDVASAASLSLYFERYNENWTTPADELTGEDVSQMSNAEILDTFAEFYDDDQGYA